MSFISKILSSGTGDLIDKASQAVKRFVTTEDDRNQFKLELEGLLQARDSEVEQTIRAELGAKERVLVAELNQDDNFTKRARPMVVYMGLAYIGINYTLAPILAAVLGVTIPALDLPSEFWLAWGGICSSWVIGRSAEKRGTRNKLTAAVTGSTAPPSLLD